MGPRRLRLGTAALALAACLLAPAGAEATFHLIQIREVYPGSSANPNSRYVELQMYAGGQDHVAGHTLRLYSASGAVVGTSTFAADVAGGASQSTIQLATPQAEEQFGISADTSLNFSSPAQFGPAGGAACWEEIDCVSWEVFSGALPSPAGIPAAPSGIPDGMAIRRSLARNCPTALDSADDSDQSGADFEAVLPAPRPNAVAPSERACAGSGGGGAGPPLGEPGAPQTTLRRKPPKRTLDRTPTFRFAASESGARFECKLDRKRFHSCASPLTTRKLGIGAHTFKVRAVGHNGMVDATPAAYRFTVVRPRP